MTQEASMEHYDVVVVGAGLAGLVAGATAAGKGVSTLILDGHPPGGRASTDVKGRYRFNRGAHGQFQGGENTAVLGRLGVSVPGAPAPFELARGQVGDRVDFLPSNMRTMLRTTLIGARGKLAMGRLMAGAKRWQPERVAGLTIGEWLDGFHLPDDARALMRMLVRTATYVHDHEHVSADVAVAQMRLAMAHGAHYVHGGWATMVDGLVTAARRNGAEVRTGPSVTSVGASGAGVAVVADGQEISAGAVVLAAGTPEATAVVLDRRPEAWAGLGPQVEVSCLDLGLRARPAKPVLYGIDQPFYLADHATRAEGLCPDGGGLVHVLRYLAPGEEIPVDTLRESMEEHARNAGIDPAMIEERRFLHRMTVVGAAPTPATGGLAGRPGVDSTGVPGVYVAGDWVGPRGWLSDCTMASGEAAGIAAAQEAADRAGNRAGVTSIGPDGEGPKGRAQRAGA
jgi:phytoene dehydrogenase-like protein